MSFKRYILVLTVLVAAALAGVAVLNAASDPYQAYPFIGLDALAIRSDQIGSRTARAEMLSRGPWDVVILGSSRAQVGYAPDHPVFAGKRVCNASIVWTNIRELEVVHRYALEHAQPGRILLGIDFILFSGRRGFSLDFSQSRFAPDRDAISYHLDNLISLRASFASLKMLKALALDEPPEFTRLGQSVRHAARLRNGYRALFAKTLHGFLTNPETYGDFEYSQDRVDRFRSMLAQAREAGVSVDIVINPLHATQLEAVHLAGLWPTYERWLMDVTGIVAEESAKGGSFRLISFVDFEHCCDEAVPAEGDTQTIMSYWWECSHFKSSLGGLVLERLYARPDQMDYTLAGWELTPQTVPNYLSALRQGHARWEDTHPNEVEFVRRIARKAGLTG
ncbi:MAG: hypothetical protein DYG94_13140 [Leptolyngbya sp. PLA3]|nr:MAG: hypothetical protein EDM82_13575 [Cyanobacteria bacterium CYA]MCE7969670.1 hypothetical protein [Leptolyngbya sp. PL-A3]